MGAEAVKRSPKIESTGVLKKLMADHFLELDEASKKGSPKIAWISSQGPAELLRAMGFLVYFPENHSAILGATRAAMDYIPAANAVGYSPDICSYLTSDVGAFIRGETPLTKAYGIEEVPRPDVLVYNTNQCRDVQDWFYYFGEKYKVPVIGVTSPRGVVEMTEGHVEDVKRQMLALVPPLEEISGQAFDIDRLRESVDRTRRCTELWATVLETAKAAPAPWTFFDHVIHMGPAVVARGTEEAVRYYETLLDELNRRVSEGVAAVEGERHRLYWEGMPVWGKLRDHSDLFCRLKSSVTVSTYCNSWIFKDFDCEDPFEGMARVYTDVFICHADAWKEDYIAKLVEDYRIDGIVFHEAKTCPNNSNSRYGMPRRLEERLGVSCLVLNGDLNDLRCYSEEQSRTNIEAFIEQLDEAGSNRARAAGS